jgi:HPt (histidine-containing phosphotransfer) domain-containing protein
LPAKLARTPHDLISRKGHGWRPRQTKDDLRRVGQTAHKIAGLAGTLGFRNLGDAAAQLDNQIAKHADVGLPLERYIEELDNVLRDAE